MQNGEDFTHFNEQGRAKMVDVGEKDVTTRTAKAYARIKMKKYRGACRLPFQNQL